MHFFQHLYPKSQIDVFVTVLQNDGSVLASSITCAGMALIDASIHVFDVILGSSMVRMIKSLKLVFRVRFNWLHFHFYKSKP